MKEFEAWLWSDDFGGRTLAALIMGLNPTEASNGQIEPILRKLRKDYDLAVRAHRDLYNPDPDDPEPMTVVPDVALQSLAMLELSKAESQQDKYRFYDWITCSSEHENQWRSSRFDCQLFQRAEVARWLNSVGLPSAFSFSAQPGMYDMVTNEVPATKTNNSQEGEESDDVRRLERLRSLGGAAKFRHQEWKFRGITELVKLEKAEGRKRSDEKTIRADLKDAATAEWDAERGGFGSRLGQR